MQLTHPEPPTGNVVSRDEEAAEQDAKERAKPGKALKLLREGRGGDCLSRFP